MTVCLLCFLKAVFLWKIFYIQDMIYLRCLHVLFFCKVLTTLREMLPFGRTFSLSGRRKAASSVDKDYSEQQ